MIFRTELPLHKANFSLSHKDIFIAIGSCFTNEIGNRLIRDKFHVCVNPTGTTYNPLSVAKTLSMLSDNVIAKESDLIAHHGLWHDFRFHGSFSRASKNDTLTSINSSLQAVPKSPSTLIITLGTAFAFFHNDSIVNNCHRLPATSFSRRLLSVEECADALIQSILHFLERFKTLSRVILTISPIRHLADGAHQNTISKSTLHLAIQHVAQSLSSIIDIDYFPSFEILLDELRDYRFYAEDMTHPSAMATDYIYQRFSDSYFDKETLSLISQCEKLRKATAHRPLSSALTDERRQFLLTTIAAMQSLQLSHSLDFSSEISHLQSQLTF